MPRDSGVPDHSMKRRLMHLEREVDQLTRELKALRTPGYNHAPEFRLAKTVADVADTPDYPAHPANTFKIVFLDASFTRTVGDQTLTENSRVGTASPYQSIGRTVNGMWLPEGAVVGCLYQSPLDATKGYHWLFPIAGGFVGKIEYGDTITARSGTTVGSGTVTLYKLVGTTLTSLGVTITIYNCTQQTPFADEIFIQLKLDFFGVFWWDVDDCFTPP